MERMKILMVVVAAFVAAGAAGAQDKKKKGEEAAVAVGPYSLPTFNVVKDKCKLTADQAPKVETLYKDAATKEEETKKRAKDNQTDRKDLEKFLDLGKVDVINKVKELLDDTQDKTFDALVIASAPDKKKKK